MGGLNSAFHSWMSFVLIKGFLVFGSFLTFTLLLQTVWSWKWRRRSSKVAIEPGPKVGPVSNALHGRSMGDSALEEEKSAVEEGQVWVSYRLRSDEVYHKPAFSGVHAKVVDESDTGTGRSDCSAAKVGLSHGLSGSDKKSGELPENLRHSGSKSAEVTSRRPVAVYGEDAYERLRAALAPGGFVAQLRGVLANLVLDPAFLELEAGDLDSVDGARELLVFDGQSVRTLPAAVGRGGQDFRIDWETGAVLAGGEPNKQDNARESKLPQEFSFGVGGRDWRPPVRSQLMYQISQNPGQDHPKADGILRSQARVASSSAVESLAALRVACASTPKERCALSQLASHIPALKARGIITLLEAVREDEALLGGVTAPLNSGGVGARVGNKGRAAEGEDREGSFVNQGAVKGTKGGDRREGEVLEAARFQQAVGAACSDRSSGGRGGKTANSSENPATPPVVSSGRSAKQPRTRSDRKGAAARALNAAMRARVSVSLLKRAAWVDQGVLSALAGAVFDGELFQRLCQERALLAEVRGGGGVDSRSARSRREGGGKGERRSGAETARAPVDVSEVSVRRLQLTFSLNIRLMYVANALRTRQALRLGRRK